MTPPAEELAASCHHAANAAPQLASKVTVRWLTSVTVAGLRPSGDGPARSSRRAPASTGRGGVPFTIADPPLYQRLVDRLVNAVFVPLSWLTVLVGDPPVARRGSLYKVQVTNPAGQRRTIALATSDGDAASLRDRAVARAEELGLEGWAREQPIPRSFFEHHRG